MSRRAGDWLTPVGLMNAIGMVRELYPDAIPRAKNDRIEFFRDPDPDFEMPLAVITLSSGAVTLAPRKNEYTRSFPDYDNP